jgi:branched-chain amino acid transport system ATP-binding protein
MLSVRDIHTYYGDSYVLQGVSLEVERGEVVAVLGRNGVGKTTLVRSVMGLTPPRQGRITLHDNTISGLPAHRISQCGIGYVPQGRRVFPSLSVREHLSVAARATGRDARWNLSSVTSLFPNLAERLDHRGNKLSGGEQQMLATARALVTNPRVLLMDEPSEGLAPLIVRELGSLIERLKQQGMAILLVEQQIGFAIRHADRVYIMSKGRIVCECLPAQLNADAELKHRYLGV